MCGFEPLRGVPRRLDLNALLRVVADQETKLGNLARRPLHFDAERQIGHRIDHSERRLDHPLVELPVVVVVRITRTKQRPDYLDRERGRLPEPAIARAVFIQGQGVAGLEAAHDVHVEQDVELRIEQLCPEVGTVGVSADSIDDVSAGKQRGHAPLPFSGLVHDVPFDDRVGEGFQ